MWAASAPCIFINFNRNREERKVGIEIGEDESKEIGFISGKAASEYAKMLKALSYHLVR